MPRLNGHTPAPLHSAVFLAFRSFANGLLAEVRDKQTAECLMASADLHEIRAFLLALGYQRAEAADIWVRA